MANEQGFSEIQYKYKWRHNRGDRGNEQLLREEREKGMSRIQILLGKEKNEKRYYYIYIR